MPDTALRINEPSVCRGRDTKRYSPALLGFMHQTIHVIAGLIDTLPKPCPVAFNGGIAAKPGLKEIGRSPAISSSSTLPSMKGANNPVYAGKLAHWRLTVFKENIQT